MFNGRTFTVISIDGAFDGCTSLTGITIPNSVTSIGDHSFEGCTSLTGITIPNSVTSIGNSAFNGCTSLTGITIPNSVTSIGAYAFSSCTSLKDITVPNSVMSIGGSAFENCSSLAAITIPGSVISVSGRTFFGCVSLASITIPQSVESIGDAAFIGCTSLAGITIPHSVNSIGDFVFNGCTSLHNVIIEDANEVLNLGYGFYNSMAIFEGSSGNGLFHDCPLDSLYLGRNLKYDGSRYAGFSPFARTNLKKVTVGAGVTDLYDNMFKYCNNLRDLVIKDSERELWIYNYYKTGAEPVYETVFRDTPLETLYYGRNLKSHEFYIYERRFLMVEV